jgi:hypothetical protein
MTSFAPTDGDFNASELGEAARRFFLEHGALCIRGALTKEQVEQLKTGIDQNLAQPSARAKVASSADDPGWFFEDFCNGSPRPNFPDCGKAWPKAPLWTTLFFQ